MKRTECKWFKALGRKLFYLFRSKEQTELGYWKKCFRQEGYTFQNDHYQRLLLAMAAETDDAFLRDKRIADFGCGPRGSLSWIDSTHTKIGIDLLATAYLQHFHAVMKKHDMIYVNATETLIPIPDAYLDIIFILNAFDHVADIKIMAAELRRILKQGGELIGSFNLNETKTKAEPHSLCETWLRKSFFAGYEISSWRISARPQSGYLYQPLLDDKLLPVDDDPAILWVRARRL
jgi:SAM-dependent methyltransferase